MVYVVKKKETRVYNISFRMTLGVILFSQAAWGALSPLNEEQLKTSVVQTAKELGVPGAFVLVETPEDKYTVAYGTTLLGSVIPPAINTHFRIASNTKSMMAAIILQLAGEGKLNLDDPISHFVSGVPNGENIVLSELLSMRSGLYNYTSSPKFIEALDKNPTKAWTPQEVLSIAFEQPPNFKPNAAYEYSNTNYALLGLVAEKIDNKPLSEIFNDRLFKPLGMNNTLLPTRDNYKLPKPYSHGYQYGDSSYALIDKLYPADIKAAAIAGTLKPIDYTFQNPSYATAAGGVISTAHDLAIWLPALVSGKVLNPDYQHQWQSSFQLENPEDPKSQRQYGYGMSLFILGNNKFYFHGGEAPGYNSFIGYDPVNKITVITWTNMEISLESKITANAIALKVLGQIYETQL